ncbi:DUF1828 domain-containing protein [Edwardsiella tarda]|uniref:DUF1828 domain-containing protein n=1 Tax=Edwardsiella tarda TaxID=636 RepID=UPI00351C193D
MICTTIISKVGFECFPIGEGLLRIISPFTYGNDGEHVGAFIQQISDGSYKISDQGDTLLNMEARGITLNQRQLDILRSVLAHEGVELNERGEILKWAREESELEQAISDIIRASILASNGKLSSKSAITMGN